MCVCVCVCVFVCVFACVIFGIIYGIIYIWIGTSVCFPIQNSNHVAELYIYI